MNFTRLNALLHFKDDEKIKAWLKSEIDIIEALDDDAPLDFLLLCTALIYGYKKINKTRIFDLAYLESRCDEKDVYGASIWHYLAIGGHIEILLCAIENELFDPTELRNIDDETIWHYFARYGQFDKLLKPSIRIPPNIKNRHDGLWAWRFISNGAKIKGLSILNALIDTQELDPYATDINGNNIYLTLAKANYAQTFAALLTECDWDYNRKNNNNESAWHYLVENGNSSVVLLAVMQNKCDPHIKDNNEMAIWSTNPECAEAWYDIHTANADRISEKTIPFGFAFLHYNFYKHPLAEDGRAYVSFIDVLMSRVLADLDNNQETIHLLTYSPIATGIITRAIDIGIMDLDKAAKLIAKLAQYGSRAHPIINKLTLYIEQKNHATNTPTAKKIKCG